MISGIDLIVYDLAAADNYADIFPLDCSIITFNN